MSHKRIQEIFIDIKRAQIEYNKLSDEARQSSQAKERKDKIKSLRHNLNLKRDLGPLMDSNNYSWVKVKPYTIKSLDNPEIDWKEAYQELSQHHIKETEFLIKKCRDLALKLYESEKINTNNYNENRN